MSISRLYNRIAIFVVVSLFVVCVPAVVHAFSISDLKDKILDRSERIEELEDEIEETKQTLEVVGQEKRTLEGAVSELESTNKKLASDLSSTENRLHVTELTLEELSSEIRVQEHLIQKHNNALGEALRKLYEQGNTSIIETVLAHNSLSDAWSTVDTLHQFQLQVNDTLAETQALRDELTFNKVQEEEEKTQLVALRSEISDKKEVIEYTKAEKDKLLDETKSRETSYQQLLNEKLALRDQFQQELQNFEAQLQIALDPDSIPEAESVLSWPVSSVRITQHFGNTQFAQGGAYNGSGHNGVDFGVPIGTPVLSAANGTVTGTGDTDLTCRNASYGKWVLVKHPNGLSTLYAHLSVISVSPGQGVGLGDIVGYSGNTGYSTGPHLHFTVYATQGMRIDNLPSGACSGAVYRIPVANLQAYLNPLEYLPR